MQVGYNMPSAQRDFLLTSSSSSLVPDVDSPVEQSMTPSVSASLESGMISLQFVMKAMRK